jgi:signal transduction histidine kinase/CheY-like chemotaxis protein
VITYCNQQAVNFWGRTPGPGDTYEQFWPPARRISTSDPSRPPDVMPVRNALRKGDSIRGEEATIERPDGSRIPVQVNVDPIRDGDGRIAGAITVFYDVTHLKRALTADRLKDQFVAMLAHELRNPLAALALTVELMRRDREAGIAADDVGVLDRQVANLARLVDDLLDVTRMRLGKIRLLKTPLDLRTVVKSAVASVTPGLDAKGRSLSVDLSSEPVFVEGDGDRLGQALTNLLDNAIKYTDAGGHAGVALAADVQTAVLRVSDTGIGIKPEMLPHVFELFAQEEGSFARSRGGLGIGLFVVARLAEMHGGTVEAHSEGLGKGAEFIVRLPRLSQSQVDDLRARQTTSKAPPPVPALHILVVEDNADVADKLAALLRRDGHEVRLAYDGSVGVAAAGAFPPELVLLDIALPGMDGYEVARHIRQQSGLENVKIVGLSGYTHEDARRRALDAGFDELLAKPVDLKALEATLARLVHVER